MDETDERVKILREARELIKRGTAAIIDALDLYGLQYLLQVHEGEREDLEERLKQNGEIIFYVRLRINELRG